MARWEQGDPRWIVSDRPDGHNVNGWHWEEKNCLAHVRAACDARLPGLGRGDRASGKATITGVKDVKGDASLCTRKGNKKVAVYDLTVTLAWEGAHDGEEGPIAGELKLTEFASANEADEVECTATVEGKSAGKERCRRVAHELRPQVVAHLLEIMDALLQTNGEK